MVIELAEDVGLGDPRTVIEIAEEAINDSGLENHVLEFEGQSFYEGDEE